jgi:hypothetical protein
MRSFEPQAPLAGRRAISSPLSSARWRLGRSRRVDLVDLNATPVRAEK